MSTPESPIVQAERRAWKYWNADGLSPLLTGVGCCLLSVQLLLTRWMPEGLARNAAQILLLCGYGFAILRKRANLDWLKARLIYPRTGYASPPQFAAANTELADLTMLSITNDSPRLEMRRARLDENPRSRIFAVLAAASMIPVMLIENPWICFVAGAASGFFIWLAIRSEEPRPWAPVLGAVFGGALLSFLPVNRHDRLAWWLLAWSLVLIADGAVTLFRYLHDNPVPES